ncbi:MAG: ATP-binding protein [Deltaproteobacteria bacterium]|jgi:uncharacterized protein|nr:ATP-binding protein [Deltaproteobacteria bacterium]MBT6433037.1 ATP-binding protein [Deltaproteobacteria bacterium]
MIPRAIEEELHTLLAEYPVVTILGPRQAGKTTLARHALKDFQYCNLEVPELRDLASKDPKALLTRYSNRVIFDEIQRVPQLLSYIQAMVDERGGAGQFVLTGSHQLQLTEAITQSLAGRTAILHLLPFSISELEGGGISFERFEDYVFHGFLPRIYDQNQRPTRAYANYYQTYVERDVRQLINLKDVSLFEKFVKLLAGRAGQVLNYQSLSNDVGVDSNTIKSWLSILEASFVIFKLPPYFENLGKRVIKSPKYYFMDVGLLVYLLGIQEPDQISRDPLVGNIFENLIVIECLKARYNQGKTSNLYFFRDSNGNEVDIIAQDGRELTAIEIKSSSTFHSSLLKNLRKARNLTDKITHGYLVFNGESLELSDGNSLVNFREIGRVWGNR